MICWVERHDVNETETSMQIGVDFTLVWILMEVAIILLRKLRTEKGNVSIRTVVGYGLVGFKGKVKTHFEFLKTEDFNNNLQ